MKRTPTKEDFLAQRKFIAFHVKMDEKNLEVTETGEAIITKDARNSDLRLLWLGHISNELGKLNMNSICDTSFSGYYVDYADNREAAKKGAIAAAREQHRKMMDRLDVRLSNMQATDLVFNAKCKC